VSPESGIPNPGKKTGRRVFLVVLVLLLVALAGVLWQSQRGWTDSKIKRLLPSELSPGCDRRQVEGWFQRHGIAYRQTWGDTVGGETIPDRAGLNAHQVAVLIRGTLEGDPANVSLISSGRIDIYLFLDQEGKYTGSWVEPVPYLP
jgi:hypothetical protein